MGIIKPGKTKKPGKKMLLRAGFPGVLFIIAVLILVTGILATGVYASSFDVKSGVQKPGIKKPDVQKPGIKKPVRPALKGIKKPLIPERLKKDTIKPIRQPKIDKRKIQKKPLQPAARPFLQIKEVYVFRKDHQLRVVIENTGKGPLSSSQYFTGKLEVRILGTNTRWWWPLSKVNSKGDHFIEKTTFNTKKILEQTVRIRVDIKGVNAGKPWIGSLAGSRRAQTKSAGTLPKKTTVRPAVPLNPDDENNPAREAVYEDPIVPSEVNNEDHLGKTLALDEVVSIDEVENNESEPESDSQAGTNRYLVRSPVFRQGVDRNDPPDLAWFVPPEIELRGGRPHATFKVELFKANVVRAQIDASSFVYNQASNLCSMPWAIAPDIRGGEGYEIRVTARPANPQGHDGNYLLIMRGPFEIYPVITGHIGFQILNPSPGQRVDRDDPADISWSIPNALVNGDRPPNTDINVELLKNGRVAARINSTHYSYDPSSRRCTLPWMVGPDISDGSDYKIKITMKAPNAYEYEGDFTITMAEGFSIFPGPSRGSARGYKLFSPSYGQRYAVGDRLEIIYSWDPDPANANMVNSPLTSVKLILKKIPDNGFGLEWVEPVPAPVQKLVTRNGTSTREQVYIHTITIPERSSNGLRRIEPGSYRILVKNGNNRFSHFSAGVSGDFTIVRNRINPAPGVADGRISIPLEITLPVIGIHRWLSEEEQTVQWRFDPDLEDINWEVSVNMVQSGGEFYRVPASAVRVSANGTGSVTFTLPSDFRVGTSTPPHAIIKVTGTLLSGMGEQMEAQRIVTLSKTIEILDPGATTSPSVGYPAGLVHRIKWFTYSNKINRVGVILEKNSRVIRVLSRSRLAPSGLNEMDWCVFCDMTPEQRAPLMRSGYTIRVFNSENPYIYGESASFRVKEPRD